MTYSSIAPCQFNRSVLYLKNRNHLFLKQNPKEMKKSIKKLATKSIQNTQAVKGGNNGILDGRQKPKPRVWIYKG